MARRFPSYVSRVRFPSPAPSFQVLNTPFPRPFRLCRLRHSNFWASFVLSDAPSATPARVVGKAHHGDVPRQVGILELSRLVDRVRHFICQGDGVDVTGTCFDSARLAHVHEATLVAGRDGFSHHPEVAGQTEHGVGRAVHVSEQGGIGEELELKSLAVFCDQSLRATAHRSDGGFTCLGPRCLEKKPSTVAPLLSLSQLPCIAWRELRIPSHG